MLFKGFGNRLHIGRNHIIARLNGRHVGLGAVEQRAQALGLLSNAFKAFQLGNQIGQDIADFARFAVFDIGQNGIGEGGYLLLRVGAVKHHMIGIGHVDRTGKAGNLRLFFFSKVFIQRSGNGIVRIGRRRRFQLSHSLSHGFLHGFFFRLESQYGYFLFTHFIFPPQWMFLL